MSFRRRPTRTPVLAVLTLALATLACGLGTSDDQAATVTALAETVAREATEAASGVVVSSDDAVRTAEAEATQQTLSNFATQTAEAGLSEEARQATAAAFEPIRAELPTYGVDPNEGRPGWIHPPLQLQVDGYFASDAKNQFLATVAGDFVVSSDITWNTQYGTAGCGFVVRSDGNEEKPSHYMIVMTRATPGLVLFSTFANGEFIDAKNYFPGRNDQKFLWQNDTTNRLTVVGRGLDFSLYTNGILIGEITAGGPPSAPVYPPPPPTPTDVTDPDALAAYNQALEEHNKEVEAIRGAYRAQVRAYEQYNTKFDRGFITMLAINESGYTDCKFDNTWLWLLDG